MTLFDILLKLYIFFLFKKQARTTVWFFFPLKKELNKKAKGIEVKQLWETTDTEDFLNGISITDPDRRKFIKDRLEGFDTLEEKLNALIPLLQSAKHETMDYYRANPKSFAVVYGTDLANDYLNDLIDLFKKQ